MGKNNRATRLREALIGSEWDRLFGGGK